MKKYKHFFKTNLFLTLFLSGIFLTSCNNSVREYFEYYTDSAAIELMNLENVNGTSPSGFKSIDSNYDGNAEFILRNPKKYTLYMDFYATEKFAEALLNTHYSDPTGDNWTVTQNASDPNIAQLWINKNLLNFIDKGQLIDSDGNIIKTITGEITIEDSETHRPFESYDVKIMVNSPPPYVKQAMVQIDNDENKYVICFYIPKFSGTVHACDTHKLIIAGKTYYFKDDSFEFYEKPDYSGSSSSDFSLTAPSELTSAVDGGPDFSSGQVPENCVAVYYRAGEISTGTVNYDIILEDDFGFKSITTVSNTAEKLNPVVFPSQLQSGNTVIPAEEDGYAYITLYHNGKTENETDVNEVLIEYDVIKFEGGGTKSLYAHGKSVAPVTLKLPAVLSSQGYLIFATAKKAKYVDSDVEQSPEFSVSRSPVYYVSQSGKSPLDGGMGTKVSPFRTIQQAVDDITTQAVSFDEIEEGYTINLLSNITPAESDDKNYMVKIGGEYKYTINGNGHTIDAKNSNKQVICIEGSNTDLTINDAKITGSNFNGRGGAIFSKGSLTLKNVEITNNFAAYGAGIFLQNYAVCNFISGSVHDNTATQNAGGILMNDSTLTLGDASDLSSIVKIYNNKANGSTCNCGGVSVDGTFTIKRAQIYDNTITKDGNDIPNNVYLPTGKTINVGGNLSGCTIGVTTADSPSSGNTIQITTGYSNNNNLPPSKIFKSDEGYGVLMDEIDNAEAFLAVGGGIIDVPSQIYDDVKLILSSNMYIPGEQKNISITAKATVNGSANTDVTNSVTINSTKLYCHSEEVPSSYYSVSGKNITLNSSLAEDCYSLVIQFEYNKRTYSSTIDINPNLAKYLSIDDWQTGTSSKHLIVNCSDKEDLKALSTVSAQITLKNIDINIKKDITLTEQWTPIDNFVNSTFNGNNHKISGLDTTSINNTDDYYGAFFNSIKDSTIQNLTISGVSNRAGLVGKIGANSNLINCISYVEITKTDNTDYCGGLVAYYDGNATGTPSNIVNCINYGNIIANNTKCVAGIGGYPYKASYINCSNYGNVTGSENVAGIAGRNYNGAIYNCVNYGDISGSKFCSGISKEKDNLLHSVNYGAVSASSNYALVSSESGVNGNNYSIKPTDIDSKNYVDKTTIKLFNDKKLNSDSSDLVDSLNSTTPQVYLQISGVRYEPLPWIYDNQGRAAINYGN